MSDIITVDEDGSSQDSLGSSSKRHRTNEQIKIFESIAKDMKENQTKKLDLIQQIIQPKTEIDLFFASISKTVEKFSPLEQAKVKISISNIVSEMEISHLENIASTILDLPLLVNGNP